MGKFACKKSPFSFVNVSVLSIMNYNIRKIIVESIVRNAKLHGDTLLDIKVCRKLLSFGFACF